MLPLQSGILVAVTLMRSNSAFVKVFQASRVDRFAAGTLCDLGVASRQHNSLQ